MFKFGLFSLLKFFFVDESLACSDVGGSRIVRDVEEVNVGLHPAFFEQLQTQSRFVYFVSESEVSLVLKVVASLCYLFGTADSLGFLFVSILVNHCLFGRFDQIVFFFSLGLFGLLLNARVGVNDGFELHLPLKFIFI